VKRASLLVAFCAVLLITTSFAASKKLDGDKPSGYRNDSSLRNGSRPGRGSSVSGDVGTLRLSQGWTSGETLILAPANTKIWVGGTGNWKNGLKWSPIGRPGAGSNVTIDSVIDKVTLNVDSTIKTLTLGGTSGSSTLLGFSNPQSLTVAGALTVGKTGEICSCVAGGFGTISAKSLINQGSIVFDTSGNLDISGDANNSGLLKTGFVGFHFVNIDGKLTNSGQFLLTGDGDAANLGSLVNNGTVDVSSAFTFKVNGAVSNSGAISTGGTFATGGNSITITGKLTNLAGGSLTLNGRPTPGPSDTATIGSIANSGLIDLENRSSLTVGGNVNNSGNIYTSFQGGSGGNTITINGKLTNSSGSSLVLYGPNDTATISGVASSGLVDVEGGSLQVNGNVHNSGELDMCTNCFSSNTVNITGNLNNSGSININSSFLTQALTVNGAANNSGNITIGGNEQATLTVLGRLKNSGEIQQTHIGVVQVGALLNSGSFDLEDTSDLKVTGNAANSGSITTSSLDLQKGGNAVLIGGTLTNSGLFALYGRSNFGLSGTDFARLGNLTNTGTVHVGGQSELQVDGNVTNSGTMDTAGFPGGSGSGGNSILIGGMLTNTATGQITLYGSDLLQASGGLTNNGLINAYGSVIDPPFVNNGGTINIDSISKMVVGMGSPAGLGYIQLHNGTLGEMISATGFGVINVNGSALLDGTLAVLLQGVTPPVGSMYKFLFANPGQISGTFASILNDIFNGGSEKWLVTYDNADGFVELTAEANNVPEPATLLVLIPGLLGMAYGLRRRSVR
jgi:fibronectin-binding autotransporter adhesin